MSNLDWEPRPPSNEWIAWVLTALFLLGLCIGPFIIR